MHPQRKSELQLETHQGSSIRHQLRGHSRTGPSPRTQSFGTFLEYREGANAELFGGEGVVEGEWGVGNLKFMFFKTNLKS